MTTKKKTPHPQRKDAILSSLPPRPKNARYTYEQMADALQRSFGKVTVAARFIGCDRGTIYDAFQQHPELKEIGSKAEDFAFEMAVIHVMQGAVNGNRDDIDRLLLHTKKGLLLGFAKRLEFTGAEGGPIEVSDRRTLLAELSTRMARLAGTTGAQPGVDAAKHGRSGRA